MPRYAISGRTTNAPTSTLPGASLYAAASVRAKLRLIELYNTTAVQCEVAINRLSTAGTQGAGLTEAKLGDTNVPASSSTGFQSHTGTPPTLGDELKRATLGAAAGAGVIWVFDDDEGLLLPAGTANGIGILCPTGTGQVLAFNIEYVE